MAKLSVNGLDDFMLDLMEAIELPDSVAEKMLEAEAQVVEKAQVYTGMSMGVHRTGMTLDSITHTKMKRGIEGTRSMYVYPQGTNAAGNRNAEVAFINEYGKKGQPARPFIRDANEMSADAGAEAMETVYDEFLKSKGL